MLSIAPVSGVCQGLCLPRRVRVAALALVGLAGMAQAQLLSPPPPAEKPPAPVRINDLKAQEPPAPVPQVDPMAITDRPDMAFETQQIAFGRIPDTDSVDAIFKFTNKGNRPLILGNMHATCGCTLAELDKKEYAPGESGKIKVAYNPRNKHGAQSQSVTIETNDPRNPRIMLSITADVMPLVSVDPLISQLGLIRKGESRNATITITGRTADFEVTDVTSSNPELVSMTLGKGEDVDLDGQKARRFPITVTLAKSHAVGRVQQSGTIRTNNPSKPIMNFQVMGDVQGDLTLTPARLSLGAMVPGAPIRAEARVTHRDGKAFNVKTVRIDTPSLSPLSVTFKPSDSSNPVEYVMTVTGQAGQRPEIIRGELVISTDIPMEEEIRLPFFGNIRGPGQ